MLKGTITQLLDDGRGFIGTHDGTEFRFHRDDLDDIEFDQLEIGHAVEFAEDFDGNAVDRRAVQIKTSLRRVV
jgi:cold shock CspA family protein